VSFGKSIGRLTAPVFGISAIFMGAYNFGILVEGLFYAWDDPEQCGN
jgi:hypothetical protein